MKPILGTNIITEPLELEERDVEVITTPNEERDLARVDRNRWDTEGWIGYTPLRPPTCRRSM